MTAQRPATGGPARPTLILTRPAAQSQRFAAEFRERFGRDWPVAVSPLAEVVHLNAEIRPGYATLVFTSENGVDALARLTPDRSRPAICVGERTAARARFHGFPAFTAGGGDARSLAAALVADPPEMPVLVVRGADQSHDIAADLVRAGHPARSVILYRMDPAPPTAAAFRAAAGPEPALLALFSPLSAERARSLVQPSSRLLVVSLGPAVTAAARSLNPVDVETALHPDSGSMIEAAARLLVRGGWLEDRDLRH